MKKRLLITLLVIALFSAVSVYVIILAQGYRIDNVGQVINTSIIRINSIPTDVVVYINDQKADKKENRVEGLAPGTTKITLKKEGYKSWEKIVNLKAGIVEDINAQLYPERLQFEKLTSSNIDKFYISSNSDYLFYTVLKSELSSNIGLWRLRLSRTLLDFNKNEPEKVFTFPIEILSTLNEYEISVSPDNSKAFLNDSTNQKLYLLDLNSKSNINVGELVGFYPKKLSWFEGSNSAILSTDQLIASFDINSKQLNLVYFSGIGAPIYSVGNSVVYYYRKDLNQLFQYQSKTNSSVTLTDTSVLKGVIARMDVAKDSDKFLLISTDTTRFFVDLDKEYVHSVEIKGQLLSLSPNGKSYVEEIDETNLTASYFKDNLDKKTYTYYSNNIEHKKGLEFLNYTDNSRNIVFVMNQDSREVWISDFDGLNLAPVIQNEVIASQKVLVSDNALDLFVLLEDSSSSIDNSKVNNIYKFKLEIQ